MSSIDDKLTLNVRISEDVAQIQLIIDQLDFLNDLFPFELSQIQLADAKPKAISGLLDPKVKEALLQEMSNDQLAVELTNEDNSFSFVFETHSAAFGIFIQTNRLENYDWDIFLKSFHKLVEIFYPDYAEVSLIGISQRILMEHFIWETRTFNSTCLVWLQYFGSEEYEKQGGKAILENPYVEAEELAGGVVVKVGKTPFDAYTPEGEELLVNATKALPPVIQD